MGNGRDVFIFHGADRLLSSVFTENGRFCATGGEGRLATLWDTSCGEAIMKMPPHLSPVTQLAFNNSNTLLASGDSDGLVKIWDLKEARLMRNLEGHRLGITCLAFYPSEETVVCASGSKDGRLRLWDIKRKGFFRTFGRKGGAVIQSCAFSPDGRLIAVADEESIKIYDVNSEGAPLVNLSCQNPGNLQFHQREMIMLYSTFSGGVIPGNSCLNVFDLETKETTSSVISPSRIESITFHPTKPVCFVLTEDGLKVVGLEPNRIYDSVNAPFRRIHSAFALESELLVICDDAKAPAKLMQFDIMKLCLEQPDTPHTAGSSRGIFEQSRPGTMESMYNVDSPFSEDATGAKIEIKDMQKFAALFDKKVNVKKAGETYVVQPKQGGIKNLPQVSKRKGLIDHVLILKNLIFKLI